MLRSLFARCVIRFGRTGSARRTRRIHSAALWRAIWVGPLCLILATAAATAEGRFRVDRLHPPGSVSAAALPPEGRRVLAAIYAGGPFESRRDGIVFGNREARLPSQPRGYYREFTVPTPGASDRGARRIIAGSGATGDVRTSNEYYYTNDHYQSFRRIVQ